MFVYLCIALIALTQYIQSTAVAASLTPKATVGSQQKLPSAIPLTYAFDYEASIIFQAISLPLQDIQDPFTLGIFSTIEDNFGASGLNLNQDQIILIKKTYLYLIFLTKLEQVQSNPAFKTYQSDFAIFLQDNNSTLPHIPNSTLIKSAGWNNTTISTDDIKKSSMWQTFCKTATCDAYNFFYTALNIIHNVEQQTFNYIPHIETSFYDHDYTNLRTINELTRIKIILETTNKDFYLAQCSDWKDKNSTQSISLEKQIVAFKQTLFYKNTHDIYTLLGIKNNNTSTISTSSLLTPKQLATPLKEQVWCFFMLNELLTMFYGLITPDSIENVLQYCSKSNLQPTIFPYSVSDYVYFEELLAVKSKTEDTHKQSLHPSPPVHKTEKTHVPIALSKSLQNTQRATSKAVQSQCCSWFSNIIHSVGSALDSAGTAIENTAEDVGTTIKNTAENVYSDAKEGVEDVGDAISKAAQAAIHATVGIAEGVFGSAVGILGNITGIESIEEFGTSVQKDAITNLETATNDLQTSISDFADGIKEGIAIEANIDGSLVSIITDDKKLGQDFEAIYNQVAGALVNVAAKYTAAVVQVSDDISISEMKFGMEFANLVSSAVNTIATGNVSNLENNAKILLNSTVDSITHSFSNLVSAGEAVLGAVMQSLGAIINSLTTIFIDISREITFMVMAAGNLSTDILTGQLSGSDFETALNNAKAARDSVTNTLEAHRQTINQVMGVAVAIGFTAATELASGGTATGVDAAIDAELISGDIAASTAETTAETAAETAGETTEETASSGAEEAGDGDAPSENPSENPKNPEESNQDDTEEEKEEKNNWKEKAGKGLKIGLKAFGNILNIVFGTFSIISGINADAQDALKEQQQTAQLINSWEFVNDNKINIIQNQNAYLKELESKQKAVIGNQLLNLAFIKNITYGGVNQLSQQLSKALAQALIPALTPDSNGLLEANIGSSWGIESPYIDLYPTEGFSTVTKGRSDFPFAQEVAQAPYAAQSLNAKPSEKTAKIKTSEKSKKLWFNQKVIGLDLTDTNNATKQPADPLTVSIDFQIIYMINAEIYAGIYLGGNFYNYTSPAYLADLNANKSFDIDAAHLAKMVVLFRASASAPLQLGVYEHEGKGWILQEPLPKAMQLSNYHTYNIQAELNGESLTCTVSIDGDSQNSITKTVSVTKLESQRTYGIISSGVAIQWNQSSPTASYSANRQARPTYGKTSEIEREKASKITMAKALAPKFGTMKLQAISNQAIMLNQYIYTTSSTSLSKVLPGHATDYVIFATNQNGTLNNIGRLPSALTNQKKSTVIVSLITGNAYNSTGNIVMHSSKLWETYQSEFGPFPQTINTYIATAQKQIQAALANVTFGPFDLGIINKAALQNGLYIYSCTQTINAKSASGATILDYLTPAEISGTELGNNVGMPPSSPNAQGLVSLVTGNLYSKTTALNANSTPTPISTGYPTTSLLSNIDPNSLATISKAQKAYKAYIIAKKNVPQQPTVTVQTSGPVSVTTSNLAPSGNTGPSLENGPSVNLSNGPGSQGTISNLQQQAAGSASFQLGTPSGPSVSLGNGP